MLLTRTTGGDVASAGGDGAQERGLHRGRRRAACRRRRRPDHEGCRPRRRLARPRLLLVLLPRRPRLAGDAVLDAADRAATSVSQAAGAWRASA